MATNIMPIVKFYVAKTNYKQGTVVDFSSVSADAAIIDFTATPNLVKQFAHVVHEPDGNFTVTYSDQATFNATKTARALSQNGNQNVNQLQAKM